MKNKITKSSEINVSQKMKFTQREKCKTENRAESSHF